ncbi:Trk system potassium uptake protein TrkA [anaerobic digester metagenome]
MKKVIIVGGGKVGTHLARLLLAGGHQVRVIERHAGELRALHEALPSGCVVAGSGADPAVLEATGVRDADVLAAVTGTDATNLVATSLARFEFGVPRTIARVKDPANGWMFTPAMGVDAVVDQAGLMAQLIAEEMSLGGMTTLLKLSKGDCSIVEQTVHPQAPAAGKRIAELAFPAECILVAVLRGGQLVIPHGDTVLVAGDEVIALVHKSAAQGLSRILGG